MLLIANGRFADGDEAGEPIRDYVQTVAFPGLGTGVGRVEPNACARQMRVALEEYLAQAIDKPAVLLYHCINCISTDDHRANKPLKKAARFVRFSAGADIYDIEGGRISRFDGTILMKKQAVCCPTRAAPESAR